MNVMNFAPREVITVSPDDPIDRAMSLMEERAVHHLIVAVDQRPLGIVSDRDILISTGWMLALERAALDGTALRKLEPLRVGQIMSRPVLRLTTADSAQDAARMMMYNRISAAPIVFGSQLAGIVTDTDLVRWLDRLAIDGSSADHFLKRPVREHMRSPVRTVAPDASLGQVVDILRRFHVRHVPVTRDHQLLGIISDRDVRRVLGWWSVQDMQAQAAGRLCPAGLPNTASDLMKSDVATAAPDELLRDALLRMLDRHIHSLPVVDADKLVGIITQTDFIKAIAREELL